jgi:hypothetical protein
MRELTELELEQVSGGAVGQGVATAFTTGGTMNVLHAVSGLTNATEASGIVPVGHGTITAAIAKSKDLLINNCSVTVVVGRWYSSTPHGTHAA